MLEIHLQAKTGKKHFFKQEIKEIFFAMLSLQPHPPPTLICHGLYGGILQVSPVAYSYLVAKYQMSSGPYGPIFGRWHTDQVLLEFGKQRQHRQKRSNQLHSYPAVAGWPEGAD